jgi:D-alanyl-D-alanine carboxypeptidase
MKKNNPYYTILGSKTGYLDEAGAGLVMLVERKSDLKKFIVLTMGNADYPNRFIEPNRLVEWSMKTF